MQLLSLPNELLINIFIRCDIETLGKLSQVCRRLDECISTDAVWKCMWECLQHLGPYKIVVDDETSPYYKSMCRRYVAIRRQLSSSIHSKRDKDYLRLIGKSKEPDVLSIDFGSKSTWLKRTRGKWTCMEHTRTPSIRSIVSMCATSNPLESPKSGQYKSEASIKQPEGDGDNECYISKSEQTDVLACNEHDGDVNGDATDLEARFSERSSHVPLSKKNEVRQVDHEDPSTEKDMCQNDLCLPRGPFLCTCVICEPRVRMLGKDLPASISRPATCLHTYDTTDMFTGPISQPEQSNATELTAEATECAHKAEACPARAASCTGLSEADVLTIVRRLVALTGLSVQYGQAVCQVSEPTGWCEQLLLSLVSTVYEGLGANSMCLVPKAICIAMTFGIETCLVIDSGAHHTYVSVIVNHRQVAASSQLRHIGGAHISQCLAHVLEFKGIKPKVCACQLDGRDIKEKCHLSHHTGGHRANSPHQLHVRSLRHPEGWCSVTLTEELSLAPEVMYLTLNLPEMIQNALAPLSFDLQKRLVSNILLTGGNSRLAGLASRLQLDLQMTLTQLAPWVWVKSRNSQPCTPISICASNDAVEGLSYVAGPWEAGKLVGGQEGSPHPAFTTREDYITHGAGVCLTNMQQYWKADAKDV